MKIKLENYSLINHGWINEEIKNLEDSIEKYKVAVGESPNHLIDKLEYLKYLKNNLIPSKKLAEKCIDESDEIRLRNSKCYHIFISNIFKEQEDFLNSEIEI